MKKSLLKHEEIELEKNLESISRGVNGFAIFLIVLSVIGVIVGISLIASGANSFYGGSEVTAGVIILLSSISLLVASIVMRMNAKKCECIAHVSISLKSIERNMRGEKEDHEDREKVDGIGYVNQ